MQWNPNAPASCGLEWFAIATGAYTLDSDLKPAGVSLDQSVAQVTDACKLFVSAAQIGGLYAVSVYDNETGAVTNKAALIATPNEDVSGTGSTEGSWMEEGGTTTTIYTQIDENTNGVTYSFSDYIKSTSNSPAHIDTVYYGRMSTGALSLTGKRILRVRLAIILTANGTWRGGLNIAGADYPGSFAVGLIPPYGQYYEASWTYNPSTGKPWTIADVQALDTTDEWFVQRQFKGYLNVYTAWLTVDVCDENRLAVGVLDHRASIGTVPGWQSVSLLTPTGGAWTKDSSGKHLYVVRRINGMGSLTMPYVTPVAQSPPGINLFPPGSPPIARGWEPTVDPSTGEITAMGDATTKLMGLVQHTTTGPADSVDSLPYTTVIAPHVYSGRTAEQEFSNASAQNYATLRFMAARNSDTTASLVVTLKRRSDNAVMGTALTLTVAQFDAMPTISGSYKYVSASLAAPGLLAASTQYYLEFSSTTTSDKPWSIVALDTGDAATGVVATFGGTTDRANVNGAEADRYDIPVTIGSTPVAPTGFTGALGSQSISATVCGITSIPRADLSWTATGLGSSFGRYEIQRSEDAGATWVTIATISTEATATFKDYEALRGIAVQYRMRVVRADGAISPWTATQTVTKSTTGTGQSLLLVSNFDPTYNVAYEYSPDQSFDFLEASELVLVAAYGRDNMLGYQPLEARGTTERFTIIVGVNEHVPVGGELGMDGFGPLRAIARAPLPYVCVLTHYGTRMYAGLAVASGTLEEPGGRYLADFLATSVTDTPYAAIP